MPQLGTHAMGSTLVAPTPAQPARYGVQACRGYRKGGVQARYYAYPGRSKATKQMMSF